MNKTTILYRIEKDGIGPWMHPLAYQESDVCAAVNNLGGQPDIPCPYDDSPLRKYIRENHYGSIPYSLKCAVKSFDSLLHWFGSSEHRWDMEVLRQHGFKVAMLEVPDEHIIHGNYQVMFVEYEIIDKLELDITEVFQPHWNNKENHSKMAA